MPSNKLAKPVSLTLLTMESESLAGVFSNIDTLRQVDVDVASEAMIIDFKIVIYEVVVHELDDDLYSSNVGHVYH